MKQPITSAQAMSHPAVAETVNALGEMADELRAEVEAITKERDTASLAAAGEIMEAAIVSRGEIDRLTKERDECRRQSDLQMNSAIKFCQERNAARIERDVQAEAANHWISEATRDHNALQKLAAAHKVERDGLEIQIDRLCQEIEAVPAHKAKHDALAANHKECVKCLGEALQDRADLAEAAKLALGALHAVLHDCDDIDMVESNEPGRDAGPWQLSNDAITALRQAGVQ